MQEQKIDMGLSLLESKCLEQVCLHGITITPHPEIPLPSTTIAHIIREPIKEVKKALKKLKALGFVRVDHYGGQDEDGRAFCIWGYFPTIKSSETEEYKNAWERNRKAMKDVFNIDVGACTWWG